jgi:hypothetical protein
MKIVAGVVALQKKGVERRVAKQLGRRDAAPGSAKLEMHALNQPLFIGAPHFKTTRLPFFYFKPPRIPISVSTTDLPLLNSSK